MDNDNFIWFMTALCAVGFFLALIFDPKLAPVAGGTVCFIVILKVYTDYRDRK